MSASSCSVGECNVEFSAEAWCYSELSEKIVPICEPSCGDFWKCGHVFKCRAPENEGFSCGKYFGACMGGSDDNRCADCSNRYALWLGTK